MGIFRGHFDLIVVFENISNTHLWSQNSIPLNGIKTICWYQKAVWSIKRNNFTPPQNRGLSVRWTMGLLFIFLSSVKEILFGPAALRVGIRRKYCRIRMKEKWKNCWKAASERGRIKFSHRITFDQWTVMRREEITGEMSAVAREKFISWRCVECDS